MRRQLGTWNLRRQVKKEKALVEWWHKQLEAEIRAAGLWPSYEKYQQQAWGNELVAMCPLLWLMEFAKRELGVGEFAPLVILNPGDEGYEEAVRQNEAAKSEAHD
jgi:hypothetical protein